MFLFLERVFDGNFDCLLEIGEWVSSVIFLMKEMSAFRKHEFRHEIVPQSWFCVKSKFLHPDIRWTLDYDDIGLRQFCDVLFFAIGI